MQPELQTPLRPSTATVESQINKRKATWGVACLVAPTIVFYLTFIVSIASDLITSANTVSWPSLFGHTPDPMTIKSGILLSIGTVVGLTWLPGIIIGIILLATRKSITPYHVQPRQLAWYISFWLLIALHCIQVLAFSLMTIASQFNVTDPGIGLLVAAILSAYCLLCFYMGGALVLTKRRALTHPLATLTALLLTLSPSVFVPAIAFGGFSSTQQILVFGGILLLTTTLGAVMLLALLFKRRATEQPLKTLLQ